MLSSGDIPPLLPSATDADGARDDGVRRGRWLILRFWWIGFWRVEYKRSLRPRDEQLVERTKYGASPLVLIILRADGVERDMDRMFARTANRAMVSHRPRDRRQFVRLRRVLHYNFNRYHGHFRHRHEHVERGSPHGMCI